MKVNVKAMRGVLKACQAVVEKRNTIPVLSHVMVQATPGQVILTTTDLDLMISMTIGLEEPGKNKALAFCVDASTFGSIMGKLPVDGVATIAQQDKCITISCGRAKFKLPTLPIEDMPVLPNDSWSAQFEQEASLLAKMLDSVAFAVSSEEVRYYLNGVYLHVPSDAASQFAAATDGHRLARFECELAEGAEDMPGIILPRKAVRVLGNLLDEQGGKVDVAISKGKFRFEVGNATLIGKTIDGEFPDYTRVIPTANPIDAWFEPGPLAEAVERVLTISSDKTRVLAAEFKGSSVTLKVNSPEHGTASEEVPIELSGGEVTIGFNGRYLLDVLGQLKAGGGDGARARVLLADPAAPTLWQQSDEARSTYVIMPTRV